MSSSDSKKPSIEPEDLNIDDLVPIPIDDFISGVSIPVDVFIRLGETKFIHVARTGQKAHKDQLSSYKNKKIQYLYVKKSEYSKLTKQNIAIAGVLIVSEKLTATQKTKVVSSAAKDVFRELDHMGISFETYNHAKEISDATVHMVEQHTDLSVLLESLNSCSDEILRHSMAVSAISIMIGQTLGWKNRANLEKLSLAGLLHDIGKKALPADILKKTLGEMSQEELQVYETHAYKGMQLLLSVGVAPDDVVAMVYEHHENSIGQGYPRRLRDVKLHPMGKVISLANEFCNLTMSNVNCPQPKNPREAIMYIEHTMGQPYNKEVFRALKLLVAKNELREDVA